MLCFKIVWCPVNWASHKPFSRFQLCLHAAEEAFRISHSLEIAVDNCYLLLGFKYLPSGPNLLQILLEKLNYNYA